MKNEPSRLEVLRLRTNYTTKDLAQHLRISERTYLRYEKNIHLVSQRNLLILSYLLKVRVLDLFEEDDPVRLLTYYLYLSPDKPVKSLQEVKCIAGDKNINLAMSPDKLIKNFSLYYHKYMYVQDSLSDNPSVRYQSEIIANQLRLFNYFSR